MLEPHTTVHVKSVKSNIFAVATEKCVGNPSQNLRKRFVSHGYASCLTTIAAISAFVEIMNLDGKM